MQDILSFIIKNITTHPDDVVITEEVVDGITNYMVSVNQEDVGRVIGKEGKIIKSIRAIMRVIAIQRNVRVRVSVLSENDAPQASEEGEAVETAQESVSQEEPEESLTVEL